MIKNKWRKNITLIELVVVLIIFALAIPVLMSLFTQTNLNVVDSEAIATATFYAEELMEEICLKRFDENESSPWSSSLGPDTSTLGIDGVTQENNTDHNNWDDVDDYNGYSDNPYTTYIRTVKVEYMELNGSSWQTATTSTDYKKVTVSVSRSDSNFGPLRIVMLVSSY